MTQGVPGEDEMTGQVRRDPWQWIHDNGFSWDDVNAIASICAAGDYDITDTRLAISSSGATETAWMVRMPTNITSGDVLITEDGRWVRRDGEWVRDDSDLDRSSSVTETQCPTCRALDAEHNAAIANGLAIEARHVNRRRLAHEREWHTASATETQDGERPSEFVRGYNMGFEDGAESVAAAPTPDDRDREVERSYKPAFVSLLSTMKGIARDRSVSSLVNARQVAEAAVARAEEYDAGLRASGGTE